MDVNLVLQVPTESLAVRVVVASAVAVLGARLLLRSGLRVPRIRVIAALLPAVALTIVAAVAWGSAQLPLVLAPTEAGGLPIRVGGDYLNVAPLTAPVLIGVWFLVAGWRIVLRLRRHRQARREATDAFRRRSTGSPRIREMVVRIAGQLGVSPPRVALTSGCPGGATVVGIRHPVVLVDEELAARLDPLELEGVLAHELAHVRRRDNLVAVVLGFVRDLAFFVPGGRWALRQLHAERELAADQVAATVTGRPGALASGLLKVLEAGHPQAACAALVPRGTLVGRVQHLVAEERAGGWLRGGLELLLVAAVGAFAVMGAVQVPSLVRDGGAREGLIVLWHSEADRPVTDDHDSTSTGRVFPVYRDSHMVSADQEVATPLMDDSPDEMRPSSLRACEAGVRCPGRRDTGLGLRPRPAALRPSAHLIAQWNATPVVANDQGLSIYLLSSVPR